MGLDTILIMVQISNATRTIRIVIANHLANITAVGTIKHSTTSDRKTQADIKLAMGIF